MLLSGCLSTTCKCWTSLLQSRLPENGFNIIAMACINVIEYSTLACAPAQSIVLSNSDGFAESIVSSLEDLHKLITNEAKRSTSIIANSMFSIPLDCFESVTALLRVSISITNELPDACRLFANVRALRIITQLFVDAEEIATFITSDDPFFTLMTDCELLAIGLLVNLAECCIDIRNTIHGLNIEYIDLCAVTYIKPKRNVKVKKVLGSSISALVLLSQRFDRRYKCFINDKKTDDVTLVYLAVLFGSLMWSHQANRSKIYAVTLFLHQHFNIFRVLESPSPH